MATSLQINVFGHAGLTPFKDRCGIFMIRVFHQYPESDSKGNLNDDKSELDPEASKQDDMKSAVVHTKSQVLQANKDGTDQVANPA